MSGLSTEWTRCLVIAAVVSGLAGCGEQQPPPTAAVSQSGKPEPESSPASRVAMTEPQAVAPQPSSGAPAGSATGETAPAVDSLPDIPFPEEGTPEWRMFEITRLVVPPPTEKELVSDAGERKLVDRTPEEIAADRKRNLAQVVAHAGQIIAATHDVPAQETLFTNAVHYLASAHLELALLGESDSARQLTELAEAIFASKPESDAAVESAARLLQLAQQMGLRYGAQDPEWVRAHATQARLFAGRFSLETSRCVTALLDAGRACEQYQLHDEARTCYLMLADKFGDTPFAEAVASIIRRINLEGRSLSAQDLGGPTIDGGFVSIDQFRGKHVLVVFWASDSPTFEQDFAALQALQQQHGDELAILGVNLDLEETDVDQFLETHPLKWRQVFDLDPERRGTLNPVAAHYGVATVPHYWLVGPDGQVLAAPADLKNLPL